MDAASSALRVDPDLDFIRSLREHAGPGFRKCFQCGTCSATCALSPRDHPLPRKEMAWALWGLRDRLLADPDVWLCHQCEDCSSRCPRGGRPGDVLAAVRHEVIRNHAFPRFLARWASHPRYIPLLLALPALVLTGALLIRDPLARALGISPGLSEHVVFSYSRTFPHWLVNGLFGTLTLFLVVAGGIGVRRFWKALRRADPNRKPVKGIGASLLTTLGAILAHDGFLQCTRDRPRHLSHRLVFFGFAGLTIVTLWVITIRINPFAADAFLYPFGFWSPFKMLANAGAVAVLLGAGLMIRDRFRNAGDGPSGRYFDYSLIWLIILVVLTGLLTEMLHYVRLEPHRHIAYFLHLMLVSALLFYLPYGKLAHLLYRTVALVYEEHIGRTAGGLRPTGGDGRARENDHA